MKNTLSVHYKGYEYSGKQDIFYGRYVIHSFAYCNNEDCSEFESSYTIYGLAEQQGGEGSLVLVNGTWYMDPGLTKPFKIYTCPVCKTPMKFDEEIIDAQYQNVLKIKPEKTPFEEDASVDFWPGRKISIDLTKKDNAAIANLLKNMKFDITVDETDINEKKPTYIQLPDGTRQQLGGTNWETNSATIITDENGKAAIELITYQDEIIVHIKEQYNNFYIDCSDISIKFTWDSKNEKWTANLLTPGDGDENKDLVSFSQIGEWYHFELEIKNIAKIENLKLIKFNTSVPGEIIPGVTFKITLVNAVDENNSNVIIKTTDSNGELELGILKIEDPNNDIIITLEEIGVPSSDMNFNGLYPNGIVKITLKHRQEGCKVEIENADQDVAQVEYDVEANIVTIEVNNAVTINLSGKIWLDGQTGLKPVIGPNGLQDRREGRLANVTVTLKRKSDNKAMESVITTEKGTYYFKDIPVSVTGSITYYIEFTYDGINYIATTPNVGQNDAIDSDAQEIGRKEFNERFATIVKDKAVGADNSETLLTYEYDDKSATLITTDKRGVKRWFAMTATTLPTEYNKNTENIDLGLVKKGVDLAAVTDLYTAKVIINGEERVFTYNDIIGLNDNIVINTDPKPNYNLYLYNSDYNYRINDYSALPVLQGTTHPTLENGQYNTLLNEKKSDGEIEVELTYQILLNNQSATDAKINSISYYYDTDYYLDGYEVEETVSIDGKTYNRVIIPINKTFTDSDNQGIYNITFRLKKSIRDGSILLGEKKTWVEIESYSTDTGCVDIDSAPGNILEHKTEDDTDDARGLNIQINSVDRSITGYVFEDAKTNNPGQYNTGNGHYDNGEPKVSDVIVQLIEIKDITLGASTFKLEYIWQETVSGSNTVKYITTDGRNIATYNVTNEPGQYTFKDFIPGNYIVRFIYGDGTYYDVSTTEGKTNILKYNGQDYKSTVDIYYDKTWYDTAYPINNSMARDNEARRLEEMGYATSSERTVNDLIIDSKDKLEKTWMCAETSLVKIPVSDTNDSGYQVKRGINFGLVKRPQAELTLQKHITYLKIDGVTEGSADINNYANNGNDIVNLKNVQGKGIFATQSSREKDSIGAWVVQTQLDNITGKMDVIYNYLVKNIGDREYIGSQLKTELNSGKTYVDIAQAVKKAIMLSQHKIGTYLGTAYYRGTIDNNEIEIGAQFKIEDYLGAQNSNLQFSSSNTFEIKGQAEKDVLNQENDPNPQPKQLVNVLQTKNNIVLKGGESNVLTLNVEEPNIDVTSGKKEFTYKSYVAQLIPVDNTGISQSGTLIKGATLGNLQYVQGGKGITALTDIAPEIDEFVAETVIITIDTGEDKKSPALFITAITGGLILIATGVVLIKKYVIK